jgi:hypothetical protein
VCVAGVVGIDGKWMCQRLVSGDRVPLMIVLPWYLILAMLLWKVAVQPALHSWPMEMREFRSFGMMWAVMALGGSVGWRSICVVWLD